MRGTEFFPARFFLAAPTRDQVKRLYWHDMKELIPKALLSGTPSESELVIRLVNGSEIYLLGMDQPARIEGSPWDGGILDEFANMKSTVWDAHVRPALSDRGGWVWLIGVPEGRNHYYEKYRAAIADKSGEWDGFTWKSADILDPREIESARADLDPLLFAQEYEASFVAFEGRAYYAFEESTHCAPLSYDPNVELVIAFDFNVSPGVAAIAQEQKLPRRSESGEWLVDDSSIFGTGWIGEVWIPRASNTELVCRRILQDWSQHRGPVVVYGDATGGNRGSAQIQGSDVDLLGRFLRGGISDGSSTLPGFGSRLSLRFPRSNPAERSRVNAVNTRFRDGSGRVRMLVDPSRAPHLVRDFEGVRTVEGGSGEIEKKSGSELTHISDAAGYYVAEKFPIVDRTFELEELVL